MRTRLQILLVPTVLCGLTVVSHANPIKSDQVAQAVHAEPCSTSGAKAAAPSTPTWRAEISRRSAVYVILHIQKACRILADSRDKDSPDAPLSPQLTAILTDLHTMVLGPIYRSYPDLESTSLPERNPQKMLRATRRDIRRSTAVRLSDDIAHLQQQIYKLSAESLGQPADRNAAEKAMQPFVDAGAELSFAEKIAFDAYPKLFAKKFDAVPEQPRTEEGDASFRKGAPPLGSVRLSDSALLLIKSFMRQVRRDMPKSDHVASIGWTTEQKSKGPGDADWIDRGSGWVLGAYLRTQVPPDVIDKVRDIEIVFSAEDPSSLTGKIVDAKNQKLFVHD
jgi:hypothetical protein